MLSGPFVTDGLYRLLPIATKLASVPQHHRGTDHQRGPDAASSGCTRRSVPGASHRSFVMWALDHAIERMGQPFVEGEGVPLAATRSPRLHPTPLSVTGRDPIREQLPKAATILERRTELKHQATTRVGMTTSGCSSNPMSTSDAPQRNVQPSGSSRHLQKANLTSPRSHGQSQNVHLRGSKESNPRFS